jgi:hypothetical protein
VVGCMQQRSDLRPCDLRLCLPTYMCECMCIRAVLSTYPNMRSTTYIAIIERKRCEAREKLVVVVRRKFHVVNRFKPKEGRNTLNGTLPGASQPVNHACNARPFNLKIVG